MGVTFCGCGLLWYLMVIFSNVQFLEVWSAIKAFTDAFGKEPKSTRSSIAPQPSKSAGKEDTGDAIFSPFS